ncbi:MAG: NAD(P)-dependent oxidoreductase [Planctomycetia bacterium]|nr:NAD(P)-dependent oxidoreductase [Planctomycetia bacterium]
MAVDTAAAAPRAGDHAVAALDMSTAARMATAVQQAASGQSVGVLGATSLVGRPLLSLLAAAGRRVLPCSRAAVSAGWCRPGAPVPEGFGAVASWIALCPLWCLPDHLDWIGSLGARTLVALSSTSVTTKRDSVSASERRVAAALADAEAEVAGWAGRHGVRSCILRPTMIYDGMSDGNVAAIARFVRRWHCFPIRAAATGLRQPVHAADVAAACAAALDAERLERCYDLSGGETLQFREIVRRTCAAEGLRPRLVSLPAALWQVLLPVAHAVGLGRGVTLGMARRMNEDLVFDHSAAARDLGFRPRPFQPHAVERHDGTGTRAGAARGGC